MLDSFFAPKEAVSEKPYCRNIPWVEKYRPSTIENVVSHEDIVSTLRKCLSKCSDGFPNLLFYGFPGTGKTSTIIAACKQLFEELYNQRVLELNASDDRGIQVVRDKIKTFAQLSASAHKLKSGKLCPAFKIIILDEADAMTTFAQAALRRTMEVESKTTRFCLICNYVSKIIEPIISRCMILRFRDLPKQIVSDQLKMICKNENVNATDEAIEFIVDCTQGDLRKAINTIQSSTRMISMEKLTLSDIQESSGVIPNELIEKLMLSSQTSVMEIQKIIKTFLKTGYSACQLLNQIQQYILSDDCLILEEERIINAMEKIAIIDKRLIDGGSEYLLLLDLFCNIFLSCS